jgi:HAD superfamily hydrolase (TIGR01490 family)
MATKASIAAFDLDGTLLNGQSGSLIVRYLIVRRLLPLRTTLRCLWWGVRYKLHLPLRQNEVREVIYRSLNDLPPEGVHRIMASFHRDVMVPRYRPAGLAELRRREEAGEHVALISATFDLVADEAAAYLGCDVALATVMERDGHGRYTGAVQGSVVCGAEKVERVRDWADRTFGEDGWTLARAYGDHYTDVPLLEAAVVPNAVNPGPTLKRKAKRQGWNILNWK